MAAVDYFVKMDVIDGESTDRGHEKWIPVMSFTFGASRTGSSASATGGAGAGKVQFQDFHFSSEVSKASPKLFQACASGEHFKKVIIAMRTAGGDQQQDFYKITFSDCLISSYQTGGRGNENLPTENISLAFAKIELSFQTQSAAGGLLTPIEVGWDLKTNRAL